MANPQLENGYLKIANELFEKVYKLPISGGEFRILLCVLRKTYGWGKKEDMISLSQFQKETGLTRARICISIKKLVSQKILLKNLNVYKINKNWEQWVVSHTIPLVSKTIPPSIVHDTKSSIVHDTHKRKERNYTKEIIWSQIENLLSSFPLELKPLVSDFLELAASENKTGKIADSRKLSILNQLLNINLSSPDKFKEALEITINNSAPNPNYIKKVIKNMGKKREVQLKLKAQDQKQALEEARIKAQKKYEETQEMIREQDEQRREAGFKL